MDFIVKGKKVTSYDLKKQTLSEIRKFLIDNGLLTMFYEKSIKVLALQNSIKIYKIDKLARIANKILMPYFVMYLHQYDDYRVFREGWKEWAVKYQKKTNYTIFPIYVHFYDNVKINKNTYENLYGWDGFIRDIVILKAKDMSFFKPSLKTRIIERLMKIW